MHDRNLELKILLNRNTHGSLGGLINTENSRLQLMFPQNFSFQTSTHVSIIQQKQRKKFFTLKLHSDPYLVKVVNLSKNKSIDWSQTWLFSGSFIHHFFQLRIQKIPSCDDKPPLPTVCSTAVANPSKEARLRQIFTMCWTLHLSYSSL